MFTSKLLQNQSNGQNKSVYYLLYCHLVCKCEKQTDV